MGKTGDSLGTKAASGGRWGAIRTVFLQLATTVTTLVLARILAPNDFGAVAAALVIVGMFDLLTQVGLGTSLVRRVELDDREASTVFWMATGLGVAAGALAVVLAPSLSRLMAQPEAALMVMTLALTIPLSLTRNIGRSLLLRNLRFRASASIEMSALLFYVAIAISLAVAGFGPWAIVIGYVTRSALEAVLLFAALGWLPRFVFDRSFVRREIAFSGGVLGNHIFNYLNKNLDYWVVSAVFGASALGIYYIAFVLPDLIRRRLNDVAREVLFPVLTRIYDDKDRARAAYLKVVRSIGFVSIPAMAGVAVLSDVVVRVAFGEGWEGAAAPMAVLALSSAVLSVSLGAGAIAFAIGRPHITIPANAAGAAALGFGLMITAPSGDLVAIAWAVVVAALVRFIGLHLATGRHIGLRLGSLIRELVPIVVPTAVMASLLWLLKPPIIELLDPIFAALVSVAFGVIVYILVSWALFRFTFLEQLRLLRTVIIPRRSNTLSEGETR